MVTTTGCHLDLLRLLPKPYPRLRFMTHTRTFSCLEFAHLQSGDIMVTVQSHQRDGVLKFHGITLARILSFARVCRDGVWFGFVGSALLSCGWRMRCIVVKGDAWPLLLSPCNTFHDVLDNVGASLNSPCT